MILLSVQPPHQNFTQYPPERHLCIVSSAAGHNGREVMKMVLTQKETELLTDLQTQEQVCIDKYNRYASQACDPGLRSLFTDLAQTEQTHLNTVNQMLSGTVPQLGSGHSQSAAMPQPSACNAQQKQQDAYLCRDSLATEKHVSSVYDTCVFEFRDQSARDMLNHIQKEEQSHGKRIYDYMNANGMY